MNSSINITTHKFRDFIIAKKGIDIIGSVSSNGSWEIFTPAS